MEAFTRDKKAIIIYRKNDEGQYCLKNKEGIL